MSDRERAALAPAELTWGEAGLLPAVVQDVSDGAVLMLAYMDRTALERTLETGRAHFFSRSRQRLWMKGESSGNVQLVESVSYDCDADALLLRVDQQGTGACHTGERSCFYRELPLSVATGTRVATPPVTSLGATLADLAAVLEQRRLDQPEGSYTVKLLTGPQDKLLKKIAEESGEVIIAARDHDLAQTRYEIADLFYHLLVVMVREGITPDDLAAELASRRK